MPPAAPARRPFRRRPPGEAVRGADLFASGVYRGKRYTADDLDEIATNFTRLRALLDPPLVLGHEEEQDKLAEYLERTDLPAAGWVERVWVERYPANGGVEATLKGDLIGVPTAVADDIRAGRYRKVSAEIYDDFEDDYGRRHGLALRRVGLLGAEVPQVKRIGDLPAPRFDADRYAEPRRLRPGESRPTAAGTVLCFAEAGPMTRDETTAELTAAMPGLQRTTLDALPDDAVADLAKNLPKPAPPTAGLSRPPAGVTPMADPAAMTREDLIAELSAAGEDPAALQAMTDDDLRALFVEMGLDDESEPGEPGETADAGGTAQTMGDPATMTRDELIAELVALGEDPAALEAMTDDDLRARYAAITAAPAADPAAAAPPPVAAMSDARRSSLMTYAEQAIRTTLANTLRHNARMKKERIAKFCEQLVKDGKILPRDVGFYTLALGKMSDTQPVHAFTEAGKARKGTELDKVMADLAGRTPVVRFAERLPSTPKEAKGREERAVRRFADTQAGSLTAGGSSPEQYVQAFCEMRKKRPTLTAAEYGVPAEYYA
jgi:hypothetical protein